MSPARTDIYVQPGIDPGLSISSSSDLGHTINLRKVFRQREGGSYHRIAVGGVAPSFGSRSTTDIAAGELDRMLLRSAAGLDLNVGIQHLAT